MLKWLKTTFQIKTPKLMLFSALYFGFILNIAFLKIAITNYHITDIYSFFCFLFFFLVVPFPYYIIFNIVLIKKITKPILALFLFLSSITNYFMLSLGVYINKDMIRNVMETSVRETTDLLTWRMFVVVLLTGILPCLLLLKTKIVYKSFKNELFGRSSRIFACIVISAFYVTFFYKELAPFARNNNKIDYTYNTLNYVVATAKYIKKVNQVNHPFSILDKSVHETPYKDDFTDVVIFILGETARSADFELYGYPRETNPLLSKQNNIIAYSNVSSCGTATSTSVPCIFSNKGRANFNVDNAPYEENLLDFFKKAGWKVIWRENDEGCKKVCERVATEFVSNNLTSPNCFGSYCHDEVLLEGLKGILDNVKYKEKTFIILHTIGSHGPAYYQRYPKQFRKFTPTCDTADIKNCSAEELRNTYDNTILYTDYFVSSVIDLLKEYKQFESSVIYLSDHGESLGENGVYLHGVPYSIAPKEQREVPFIIWLSDNVLQADHLDYNCLKNFSKLQRNVSHDYFYHTMLGLSEIDTKLYKSQYDLLNKCRIKKLDFMKRN